MNRHTSSLLILALLIACFSIAGCSENKAELEKQHAFRMFGLRYHQFFSAHGRSPANIEEMREFHSRFESSGSADSEYVERVFQAIDKGEIVVIWNADITNDGETNDQFVLAYYLEATQKEGLILTGGGSVEEMKSDQFDRNSLFPERSDKVNE